MVNKEREKEITFEGHKMILYVFEEFPFFIECTNEFQLCINDKVSFIENHTSL